MSVASFSNVSHYRDLSFFQLYRLKSTTNEVEALNTAAVNDQNQILDWQDTAYRLNDSITQSEPFLMVIGDFLTLQFIKKWVVQAILPGIIQRVDTVAAKVYVSRGEATPKMIPEGRVKDLTTSSSNPSEIMIRANEYFQENKRALCRIATSKNYNWSLHEKRGAAKELENEIDEYFQDKIKLLISGQPTALPLWYHATKENNLVTIINSGNLEQRDAIRGKGVYFSTEDESKNYYGNYTFAVDYDVIRSLPASHFNASFLSKNAVWVRVEENVPIKWDSVAHIIVNSKEAKTEMLAKLTREDGSGLTAASIAIVTCPVLTRLASDLVRETLQKTYTYILPDIWKKLDAQSYRPYRIPHIRMEGEPL